MPLKGRDPMRLYGLLYESLSRAPPRLIEWLGWASVVGDGGYCHGDRWLSSTLLGLALT